MDEITISLTKENAEILLGILEELGIFVKTVIETEGDNFHTNVRNAIDSLRYAIEDKIS